MTTGSSSQDSGKLYYIILVSISMADIKKVRILLITGGVPVHSNMLVFTSLTQRNLTDDMNSAAYQWNSGTVVLEVWQREHYIKSTEVVTYCSVSVQLYYLLVPNRMEGKNNREYVVQHQLNVRITEVKFKQKVNYSDST